MKVQQPSLGGRLTMANVVAVLALFLTARFLNPRDPEWIWIVAFFALTLPFAWLALLPEGHGPTQYWQVVWPCVAIGANSFVWGYGLAAILKWWLPSLRNSEKELRLTDAVRDSSPRAPASSDRENPYAPPGGG